MGIGALEVSRVAVLGKLTFPTWQGIKQSMAMVSGGVGDVMPMPDAAKL